MSLPFPTVTPEGKAALDALLSETMARKPHVAPAIFYAATNAKGKIYENQQGTTEWGNENAPGVTSETYLQLYSMTKFITGIACMQLVERGLISLDDGAAVEALIPQIVDLQILEGFEADGEPILRKRGGRKITLRMLLSHTSGMSYNHRGNGWLETYRNHTKMIGFLAPNATIDSIFQPLLHEPATRWDYSIGIDYGGAIVTALTGLSLEEYFQKNIFKPLGMKRMTFIPPKPEEMMYVCKRVDGELVKEEKFSLNRNSDPATAGPFFAGGAGLFGTVSDYLLLLQNFLACSSTNPSPPSHPILSPAGFAEFFTDSIPIVTRDVPSNTCAQDLADEMIRQNFTSPKPTAETVGHSIGLVLTKVDSDLPGRKAGSGTWSGLAKSYFWVDPASGLAAICATQVLAPNPDPWTVSYNEFEAALYKGLSK